ncbi:hypothetical protein HWI79_717 [Cryptosporidium felis]|nr:hypothetical protein HWI79_717 [Cryptosporidium felis]
MSDISLDETQIRDTIRLLHDKLSVLFYLNNTYSLEILQEIDLSISKCSNYGISSCTEIIIPPIIMAIHNCIRNAKTTNNKDNIIGEIIENSKINYHYSLRIEKLLSILSNLLKKICPNNSIIMSRKSLAFFDILNAVINILRIFINEKNDQIIRQCIEVIKLNFQVFWDFFKLDKSNETTSKQLIIPVTIQYLLNISFHSPNSSDYPMYSRMLSLELLSEIPVTINDIDILIKVYPGVIQKLFTQIIDANLENISIKFLEKTIIAIIEWQKICLGDENTDELDFETKVTTVKNTGKIFKHIFRTKTIDFNFYNSFIETDSDKINQECLVTKIKFLFIDIIKISLSQCFGNFSRYYEEFLIICLDFLISLNCDKNPLIRSEVKQVFDSLFAQEKQKNFFCNYLENFRIDFQSFDLKDKVNINSCTKVLEFSGLMTKYTGFLLLKDHFLERKNFLLSIEAALKSLFQILISDNSLLVYKNFTKNRSGNKYKLIYENSISKIGTSELRVIDVIDIFSEKFFNKFETNDGISCKISINHLENTDIFHLFGDLFTSIFFDENNSNFEKCKIMAKLILDFISISILNLNIEITDFNYIDNLIREALKLDIYNTELNELFLKFIISISICNLMQSIVYQAENNISNLYAFHSANSNIKELTISNWLDFAIDNIDVMNKDHFLLHKEINLNTLLILTGNILRAIIACDINRDLFINKLNGVAINLLTLYCCGTIQTKMCTEYVLFQLAILFGYSPDNEQLIKLLFKRYSLDILKSFEMMYYSGFSEEKIELLLVTLEICPDDFVLELSDTIERFNEIDIQKNKWLFKIAACISKKLSFLTNKIWQYYLDNHFEKIMMRISTFKREIDKKFPITDYRQFESVILFYLESLFLSQENILDFSSVKNFFSNNHNCYGSTTIDNSIHEYFQTNINPLSNVSNIRVIAEKIISVLHPFSSNIDTSTSNILDYQHLSAYALINCIFALSSDLQALYPYIVKILPSFIGAWEALITTITSCKFHLLKMDLSKLRELVLINKIIIQMVISCNSFVTNIFEDKLIPLILKYIEFIFNIDEMSLFIDDKEAKSNSEVQKLCISVIELIYYFTKYYMRLNTANIKYETLSSITNILTSPKNDFFSSEWRLFVSKTIIYIYITFPGFVNTQINTMKYGKYNMHLNIIMYMRNIVEKHFFETYFDLFNDIISNTHGEKEFKLKLNK